MYFIEKRRLVQISVQEPEPTQSPAGVRNIKLIIIDEHNVFKYYIVLEWWRFPQFIKNALTLVMRCPGMKRLVRVDGRLTASTKYSKYKNKNLIQSVQDLRWGQSSTHPNHTAYGLWNNSVNIHGCTQTNISC